MQEATLDKYAQAYDRLKTSGKRLQGNIFLTIPELKTLFAQKKCFLEEGAHSLFLFVPRHNQYYDLLFHTTGSGELETDLDIFLATQEAPGDLRASVIGIEPQAGEYAALFQKKGFNLLKKLLRTECGKPNDKIIAIMRQYAEEQREFLDFAKEGDEKEILEILKENFDVAADNLPEPDEIRKAINAEQVAILRRNGQICAFVYFTYKSNIMHSLYDVTRKEHRGANGYFMALSSFLMDKLEEKGLTINRSLGWREEKNRKLVKHAKKNNQIHDGVVIYNTFRPLRQGGQTGQ